MNLTSKLFKSLLITVALFSFQAKGATDYASFVNPFIGTGGHGHTYPGAVVPNGMIHPSPDTRIFEWDACSGYYHADNTINGFSHLHLSGTGCGDYGEILLMPTVGEQSVAGCEFKSQTMPYASAFKHENEVATPGYYSVVLDRYHVKAELSATERAAIHRYTFPKSDKAGFILDMDYSLQGQSNRGMEVEVVNDRTIRGYKATSGWAWRHDTYFIAEFSKPFTCDIVNDSIKDAKGKYRAVKKVLLHFSTAQDEQVLVKVALSSVDANGAKANLAEIPAWDFDAVKTAARDKWNRYLSKIDISTTDNQARAVFYTALYHTGIAPSLFTDADGRYRGLDRKIHEAAPGKPMYTIFSLWDTFRALHPLMTIIDPKLNERYINALLMQYKDGGILPMWELAGNYTGTMIGYNAVPVIVDSYMKGYRDFDVNLAFEACKTSSAYNPDLRIESTKHLIDNALMTIGKYYKNTIGYIPSDKENESVAKGLECAYADWCISQFANALGKTGEVEKYARLGQNYKNYFDPSVRFMRGKNLDGTWREPFNPRSSNHRNDDYCEGTAWQWTWFVPQDVPGLVGLMGGKKGFIGKLDSLFTASSKLEGELTSADISGLIGQFAHGNEPSHHILHLYNYVQQPWKTQDYVDNVLHNQYFNAPNGLSGNEDCGQMSAWYILNAMGFYQVCPGNPTYSIGRPLFDNVSISLPGGKKFRINVANNSATNKYIKSATLNGKKLDKPFFTHAQLSGGGELNVVMTDKPTKWGTKK